MKKIIYPIALVLLLMNFNCTKSTDGNTGIVKQENNENKNNSDSTTSELTERYVADDGSSALVTLKEGEKENSISIKSNNKIISAVEKNKTADGAIYSNYDFEIITKKDSVIITQGNNIIKLKKARVN